MFETHALPQETTFQRCYKVRRWPDPYPVNHASGGNIKGDFDGEIRLKQFCCYFQAHNT